MATSLRPSVSAMSSLDSLQDLLTSENLSVVNVPQDKFCLLHALQVCCKNVMRIGRTHAHIVEQIKQQTCDFTSRFILQLHG